jgi:hypothetical protein
MSERKNFSIDTINDVFREQGYCCNKCGKSLKYGFEAHHKDSDNTNDTKENCELLCAECHDSKLWATIREQKIATIAEVDILIKKACDGQIAGAALDKALDAIKLKLSLEGQVNNLGLLDTPVDVQLESYVAVMEAKQQAYYEGYIAGLNKEQVKKVKKE